MLSTIQRHLFSPVIILRAILVVGIVFRIWNLAARDAWFDEAFSSVALKQPLATMLATIKADVHPPLFYLLAKPLAATLHYSTVGIRLLSVTAGVLGIIALYFFVRALISRRAALWSAALLAVLPFAVQYSQEARMYTLFSLFVVLAAFAFLRSVQKHSWQWACASGALVGLGGLTHYLALLYGIIIPLAFVPSIFFSAKRRMAFRKAGKLMTAFLFGVGIVFALWLPAFLGHLRHMAVFTLQWITPATPQRAAELLQTFLLGTPQGRASQGIIGPNQFSGLAPIVTLLLTFALVAAACFTIERKYRSALWPLLVLSFGQIVLLYFLSLLGKQYFVSRYMLPSAYFLCVVLGTALSRMRPAWAAAVVAVYVLLMPLRNTAPPAADWKALLHDPLERTVAHYYVLNPFDYMVAQYELGANRVVLYNSDSPTEPVVGWAGIGPGLRQETKSANMVHDSAGAILTYGALPKQLFSPQVRLQLLRTYGQLSLYIPAERTQQE